MQRRSRSHERSRADGSTAGTHDTPRSLDASIGNVPTPLRAREGSDGTARLPGVTARARDDSYPSLPFGGLRVTANPSTTARDSLRLHDLTSPATSAFSGSSGGSIGSLLLQEMAQRVEEVEMADAQDSSRVDPSLPESDGMKGLREKMHAIRLLAISTEEKAKMMHHLMTQDYMALRAVTASPLALDNGSRKLAAEEPTPLDVGLAAMPVNPSNPYSLRPGDTDPSWSTLPPNPHDEDAAMEGSRLPDMGCMHYKRNVKVQCFDCHRWFPCRHCHDNAQGLPFPHQLRRKMTTNMLCMICQTPQPAAEECLNCGEYAAYYFCPKCKLWDNDSNKRIYHCDDCGICRVGEGLGKDFVHCKKCNVCITISTSAAHPCVEGATERDCPLCLDGLFESTKNAVSMPCGHYMHGDCYAELMKVTYKCPVCSKSAVNMELQWRKLDDEIRLQPMPEDEEVLSNLLPHLEAQPDETAVQEDPNRSPSLQPRRPRTVYVGCNDCSRRSWTPFHWLGVKCQHCDSYNTNQMAPPAGHETEAERLIRQEQQLHRQHDFTGERVLLDAGIQPAHERTDSALAVPASPSQLAVPLSPGSPNSSNGLPSPRRYFVQDDEEPRRPSFTARGFSTPSLPNLPDLPRLPRIPNLPHLPNMPNLPELPDWRNNPGWRNLPNMPQMPNYLPSMPHLDIPRFSPYDMMDSLSRSLSPMRYYLQGLDMRDDGILNRDRVARERHASQTSIRSDPTAESTAAKRKNVMADDMSDDEDELGFWGARARSLAASAGVPFGDEQAIEDSEDEEGDDDDEESESSDDDVDMRDNIVEDDDEDEDEDDELALLGHR